VGRKNLVLIGYRGTGKSTVAAILAERLGRGVISTDEEIVRRAGAPIPRIVEEHGWDWFRDLESAVVRDVAAGTGKILDCGGGAILREENRRALREKGVVVWLRASVDTIADRIRTDDQRPSLTGQKSFVDEIADVLEEREPVYREACHVEIDTENRSPAEIAALILEELSTVNL
jgi:shikimate kinase